MSRPTFWHPRFYQLLRMQGPGWVRIHTEVPISEQGSRADMVFEKRTGYQTTIVDDLIVDGQVVDGRNDEGLILRALWPRLSRFTIAEFKSVSRPFRRRDLRRLVRCAMEYHENHEEELGERDQLTVVLFVPRITRALREEIAFLGCELQIVQEGYATLVDPLLYTTYIVELDIVAEIEDNDFLRIFTSRRRVHDLAARRWMATWFQGEMTMQEHDLEGYEEAVDGFLASLTPERRMAGLGAKERLAGLGADYDEAVDGFLAALTPERRMVGLGAKERLAGLGAKERLAGLGAEERLAGMTVGEFLESLPERERRVLRALVMRDADSDTEPEEAEDTH